MNNTIVTSILISLAINEFFGVTDWLAYRITRWTAARWEAQTGFDHLDDWLEYLDHSPGRLFKVVSSLWLLLGTFMDVEHLTLNLPSLWRFLLPLRTFLNEVFKVILGLIGASRRRPAARVFPNSAPRLHMAIVKAAVSLLPRRAQPRYSEELVAELHKVSERDRMRWVMQIVLSALRLAILMRLRASYRG